MLNTGATKYKGSNVAPKVKLISGVMTINTHPDDKRIAEVIGQGNLTHGVKVALMWAAHFYNLGLREDDDLRYIGLAVQESGKYPQTWHEYHKGHD